jgi:hypothetical protein
MKSNQAARDFKVFCEVIATTQPVIAVCDNEFFVIAPHQKNG